MCIDDDILNLLLLDQTKNNHSEIAEKHIIWATNLYEAEFGENYSFFSPVIPELIFCNDSPIILSRVAKTKEHQQVRVKERAEVFTPAWICNAQNNLVDSAWFGRENVFNYQLSEHNWQTKNTKIVFPKGKSWQKYVQLVRLEISCGEAPFICSRYDAVSGVPIENPNDRIGLLDRKLRVVSENCDSVEEWTNWGLVALKSIYGYEWQGDSLFIARENVFLSFVEHFNNKFGENPSHATLIQVANVISWNFWQMDGLKFVVPESCHAETIGQTLDLFGEEIDSLPCRGCQTDNPLLHNGLRCLVKDWTKPQKNQIIEFVKLLKS